MRVVAYDISGCQDIAAVGQVVRRLDADVVGLVSVRSPRDLRAIARAADLEIAHRATGRGSVSAVLSGATIRVRSTDRLPLATSRGTTNRAAVHAILGVAGTSVSVTAVDFGLRAEVRARNQRTLRDFLAHVGPPVIVAASLHAAVSETSLAELGGDLQDAFAVAGAGSGQTFPAGDPVARHDVVLVDTRLRVVSCRVDRGDGAEAAARHRAVITEIEPIDDAAANGPVAR